VIDMVLYEHVEPLAPVSVTTAASVASDANKPTAAATAIAVRSRRRELVGVMRNPLDRGSWGGCVPQETGLFPGGYRSYLILDVKSISKRIKRYEINQRNAMQV
jgi:hypothetical protein